jgi:hypothetical protein
MAHEIGFTNYGGLSTCYALIWDYVDRRKAYEIGEGMSVWNETNRTDFDVPLALVSGPRQSGALPTTASGLPDGIYIIEYFGTNGSPASTDQPIDSEVITVVGNEIRPPKSLVIASDTVTEKSQWRFPPTGKQNESVNIVELHPASTVQCKMDFRADDGASVSSVDSAADENSDGSITLTGLAATQDQHAALVLVGGLTENTSYRIKIVCTMSNGNTIARVGRLQTIDVP